jgi:hypothetical protein
MRTDFSSQAYFRNPADELARLRAAGPVVEIEFPLIGKTWTTTTQEMADRVLKDSVTFTIRRDDGAIVGMRWWMPAIVGTLANHMLSMDEPDHARLRGIVDEAFRRRAILEMESRILALADQLADQLFADGSPADLVARYARWLPLSVICELLGLPLADRPKFTAWASRFTGFTSSLGLLRALPGILAMKRYLQQRLEAARREGGEGLIAELVRLEKEGGRIASDELVAMLFLLLFADASDQRIGVRARAQSGPARLARTGLEPGRSRGRGIFALRIARAIHQTALRPPGGRTRRRASEEGRQDHGDAGGREPRSARQPACREARSRAAAEPACRVRHRHPFLPWSSARAHRGIMRVEGAVTPLAEACARGSRAGDPMASAHGLPCDRAPAGGGRVARIQD